ncbi:MAG: divalent-cation tolerance protein CutA [Verrucomicrobiota bacterium]|nr:divalent-cation tolerance protein CutA [Verrucomicrobiota bacterium]
MQSWRHSPNEMAVEAILVFSTFPDTATAQRIGRELVEQHCAACANILPGVESIYWWEGKIETAKETLVLFKTTSDRYEALETTLRHLHPYEVPEIIALSIERGLPEYLRWVSERSVV